MINGEKNGNSKEYISGRLFFEGEYKNGIRNGKGREYDKDGKKGGEETLNCWEIIKVRELSSFWDRTRF